MTVAVEHLPVVVPEVGDPPEDASVGHPMRAITDAVAADPSSWTPEVASRVSELFDEISNDWTLFHASERIAPLIDALERGGPFPPPVVEVGAGAGAGTKILVDRFAPTSRSVSSERASSALVVATDLVPSMLVRIESSVPRVAVDAHDLSFADGSIGTLVCVNTLLFADEVRRVLARPGAGDGAGAGVLIWVNTVGERTPIHLSADTVAAALGPDFDVVTSRAAWGTWAVARRGAAQS